MQEKMRQMIQDIPSLLSQYELGTFSNLSRAEGGFTNDNYIIETSKGKFFLKKYLRETNERISREHQLLAYLKDQKFPIPGLIKNNEDNALTEIDNKRFTFFDYIAGHTRVATNSVTDEELINIAKTLARYHYLAKNIPLDLEPIVPIWSRGALDHLYSDVIRHLSKKSFFDDFDREINSILTHKINELHLAPKIDTDELPSLLIHGDFHAANMLFNEKGEVSAVVDWELAKHQPRIWEVICAMVFACKTDWTWNFHTPLNFERAEVFLSIYHDINPLTQKELEIVPDMLRLASADLTWPLKEHYLHKNFSSDRFLPKSAENWFFWDNENISQFKISILTKLSSLQKPLL
ncbi:MAG: hypothetical protein COU51_04845 [Parcubacteria group bacterium CG10_big_fil_rev_8_21_14_0_10_36_14]|nr:MAG: hypothetical protein COU51_04845 [Parcubacteria group bacterium CG10_big_fil_rev_8_21_14_0_10_36_14]